MFVLDLLQEIMDVSDECSLPSPLVETNQADDQSLTNEGQNIAVETGRFYYFPLCPFQYKFTI